MKKFLLATAASVLVASAASAATRVGALNVWRNVSEQPAVGFPRPRLVPRHERLLVLVLRLVHPRPFPTRHDLRVLTVPHATRLVGHRSQRNVGHRVLHETHCWFISTMYA